MDEETGPDPSTRLPIPGFDRVAFVKAVIDDPRIEVGDYTYYDDPAGPEAFMKNVLYHYEHAGDRLRIGRFCAIATGVTFLMSGANHPMRGVSTYPFAVFERGWRKGYEGELEAGSRGDMVIGNDVWIGRMATILPGVTIGDGAIIGAHAVVSRDVRPYAVAVGNPAREVKRRFDDATVADLLEIRWWDWDIAKITRNLHTIADGRPEQLRDCT